MDVLGIDIGGVLIKKAEAAGDTSFFSSDFLQTPPIEDAFYYIRELRKQHFDDRVYLVSKCGLGVQEKTKKWLEYQKFYEKTGVLRDHLYFCRTREEKAPICKKLGVTHFIDDRLEVLSYLTGVNELFLFQPTPSEIRKFASFLPQVKQVLSWKAVYQSIVRG